MSVVGSGFSRLIFHAVHFIVLTPLPHCWDFPPSLSILATYASDDVPAQMVVFLFPLDMLLHPLFPAPIPVLCLLPVFLFHLGFLHTVLVTMTSVTDEALLLFRLFQFS